MARFRSWVAWVIQAFLALHHGVVWVRGSIQEGKTTSEQAEAIADVGEDQATARAAPPPRDPEIDNHVDPPRNVRIALTPAVARFVVPPPALRVG